MGYPALCPGVPETKKKKKKKKKDFRGEGQLNESIDLFFPHPTLVGRYSTKKTVAIRSDATNNRSARLPTRRH